jgi:hypothetical protein
LHYPKTNLSQKDITQPINSPTPISLNQLTDLSHSGTLFHYTVSLYTIGQSIYLHQKTTTLEIFWFNVESILHSPKMQQGQGPSPFALIRRLIYKGTYTFWKASCLPYFQHLSQAHARFHPPCPPCVCSFNPRPALLPYSHFPYSMHMVHSFLEDGPPEPFLDSSKTEVITLGH